MRAFAPGRYAPRSPSGQRLFGHELAHVVQQAQGRARGPRFERKTTDDHDWVPGEDGYIENTGWNGTDAGLEGENIIYVGAKRFWGHFPGEVAVKTYKEWFNIVKGWTGSATLAKDRSYPSTGMK